MSKYIDFPQGIVQVEGNFEEPMTLLPTRIVEELEETGLIKDLSNE